MESESELCRWSETRFEKCVVEASLVHEYGFKGLGGKTALCSQFRRNASHRRFFFVVLVMGVFSYLPVYGGPCSFDHFAQ